MFKIYLTTDCNFKCEYCYQKGIKVAYMPREILFKAIDYIYLSNKRETTNISFMGGEPLLCKQEIYDAVEYIENNYSNYKTKYHLTTNVSLVDEEFIEFAKNRIINVRMSIDTGSSFSLNKRVMKAGRSVFEKTIENAKKIKEAGILYSIRMTVTNDTCKYLTNSISQLYELGFECFSIAYDVKAEFNESTEQEFAHEIDKLLDFYMSLAEKRERISIDIINAKIVAILADEENRFAMCDAGDSQYCVMPDGSIYPCAFLINDIDFRIGNIVEGIDQRKNKRMCQEKYSLEDPCKECCIRDACHGMKCGYMNYLNTGYINIPSNMTCATERVMYNAVKRAVTNRVVSPKLLHDVAVALVESKIELSEAGKMYYMEN